MLLTFWTEGVVHSYMNKNLTGNGPEDVGDEYLHQALVQAVITVTAPAQHRVILAKQNQAGLWETLLWLIVTANTQINKQF